MNSNVDAPLSLNCNKCLYCASNSVTNKGFKQTYLGYVMVSQSKVNMYDYSLSSDDSYCSIDCKCVPEEIKNG